MKENQHPLISIIIPVYNVEKYLKESIESILKQTYRNIEIICINDGSTDSSLKILESYARQDSRIRVISQENHGTSSARNVGLALAKGEYVYFFDSDDILIKDALRLIIDNFNLYKTDILLFDGIAKYDTTELEERFPHFHTLYQRNEIYPKTYTGKDIFIEMITNRDLIVSVCFQCFRREFLIENQIVFYEGIIHEDNLFSIGSLILAKNVYHLKKVLYIRRIRNNSITTSENLKKSFVGYFTCVIELIYFSYNNCNIFNESLTTALGEKLTAMQNMSAKLLFDLHNNLIRPYFSDPYKDLIAQILFSNMLKINKYKKDALTEQHKSEICQQILDKSERELSGVKTRLMQAEKANERAIKHLEATRNSTSYKIGRAITFFPRKIKTILKRSD